MALPPLKWHKERFLEEVGQDLELAEDLLRIFLDSIPRLLREIEDSLAQGDLLAACERAHSVKGAAGTIFLEAIREEAFSLETAHHLEEAKLHFRRLRELFNLFCEEVEKHKNLRDLLG